MMIIKLKGIMNEYDLTGQLDSIDLFFSRRS